MTNYEKSIWDTLLEDLRHSGEQLTGYERSSINLIASDNAYPRVLAEHPPYPGFMIQEGILRKRPFAGAALHDKIEEIATQAACRVFAAEHANLQPHSCSQANQAVYHALLSRGDTVLALGLQAGGHLTHGLKSNFSGRAYNFVFYGTKNDGFIDYDSAENLAKSSSPKLVICGSSSYPRLFDAQRLREIADSVGAKLMFDLSHEAGLIAAGVIPNPIPLADVATMSVDKTLRGPFGGAVLCKKEMASAIDRAVHPGTQSSFSVRNIADKAHALILTQGLEFRAYAQNVLSNAKELERNMGRHSNLLLTGGTDKHYVIANVKDAFGISGVDAEKRLEQIGILTSRQSLPSDMSFKASEASGLRLGTVWATSRGYDTTDFEEISAIICDALSSLDENSVLTTLANRVHSLATRVRKDDVWNSTAQYVLGT